ncbi:MAG: hypothetical protein NT099_09505 [Candidatus Saganbacteria bacterium]|nr:hypothetical protein [Candidatus Saganbacteria bacterium]
MIAILASVLTLAYMLSMQRKAFFGNLKPGLEAVKEAPLGISIVAISLAVITVAAGIFFPFILSDLISNLMR